MTAGKTAYNVYRLGLSQINKDDPRTKTKWEDLGELEKNLWEQIIVNTVRITDALELSKQIEQQVGKLE